MLDLELVRFMESLPLELKLNMKGGKIIHKEIAKTILPDSIINRPKKGFQSPTNKWFREEMNIVEDMLLSADSEIAKVFDQRYITEILKSHAHGFNKEKQIFLLLGIYYWLGEQL